MIRNVSTVCKKIYNFRSLYIPVVGFLKVSSVVSFQLSIFNYTASIYCVSRSKMSDSRSMEDVTNVFLSPLPDSPYVKPFRMNYTQNGSNKTWDLLEVHDSVAVVVFNITRKVMIFVKQFRPAVYYNSISPTDRKSQKIDTNKYPASLGIALEICAGIIDKNKPIQEIAREEVLEECGYNIAVESLEKIMSYRSGVGVQGSLQTLYYCEVTDDMKTESGGGVDDEIIELVEMSLPEIEDMLQSKGPLSSPPSCLFALMWFMKHKADKFRKSDTTNVI